MGSVWELLCVVGAARENKRKYLYKRKEKKVVRPITTITASAWGTSMQASWWILGSFHSARPHFFPCLKGSAPPHPPIVESVHVHAHSSSPGWGSGPLWSSLICTFPPCPVLLPLTYLLSFLPTLHLRSSLWLKTDIPLYWLISLGLFWIHDPLPHEPA